MGFLELNMQFLRALAALRTPLMDGVMALLTHAGEETVFMIVALTVFWCVDKKKGYFLLLVGFAGTVVNQALKIAFRIPRPWVLDPNFKIVEAARAEATGFSFPSGHTQNAVGTFGGLACFTKDKRLRAAFVLLALLIALSRLYLGVHTPLDVGVSLLVASALLLLCRPLLTASEPQLLHRLLWGMIAVAAVYLAYAYWMRGGAAADELDNFQSAVKNGWSILGAACGVRIAAFVDERYLHFETKAVWWVQGLKVVLGLGLTVAVRTLLKAPLNAVFGPVSVGDGLRYCAMVLTAGVLWPMSFPYFARLGRKK